MITNIKDQGFVAARPSASRAFFGDLNNGDKIEQFTLANGRGTTVQVLSWGGIIRSIITPDRDGELADIVLGYDSLTEYESRHPYFGTITGRFANRISSGVFTLDGKRYELATNNGPNHLHGGLVGFDRRIWNAEISSSDEAAVVRLTMTSPDGDQGYPGEVAAEVTYILSINNHLRIDYLATTTKPTPISLTNHSYFNLLGHDSGSILGHSLQIFAESYLPVDQTQIPTGEIAPVADSPFDFNQPQLIGARIHEVGTGYDHNFVISGTPNSLRPVAIVYEPRSGRTLEVFSTKPGVQLYTGNNLDNEKGKRGALYQRHHGFCLETQYYPDSINQVGFPSCVLRPGERYSHATIFALSARS